MRNGKWSFVRRPGLQLSGCLRCPSGNPSVLGSGQNPPKIECTKALESRWSHHRSDAGFRIVDGLGPRLVATACCHSRSVRSIVGTASLGETVTFLRWTKDKTLKTELTLTTAFASAVVVTALYVASTAHAQTETSASQVPFPKTAAEGGLARRRCEHDASPALPRRPLLDGAPHAGAGWRGVSRRSGSPPGPAAGGTGGGRTSPAPAEVAPEVARIVPMRSACVTPGRRSRRWAEGVEAMAYGRPSHALDGGTARLSSDCALPSAAS